MRDAIRTGFAIEAYHHPVEDEENLGIWGPDIDRELVYVRVLDDNSGFLVTKWRRSHEGGYFEIELHPRTGDYFRTYEMIEFDPLKMVEASNAWEPR